MAAREIDDAAAATEAPGTAGHFPRFVQFLARETIGAAYRARDPLEKGRSGKSWQVVFGESGLAAGVELRRYLVIAASHAFARRSETNQDVRTLLVDAAAAG